MIDLSWSEIIAIQASENPPRLSIEDAVTIYEDADLNELMYAAHIRRKKMVPGNEVTYLVDRNINYTNICTINCQFCSFYRPPGHADVYTQSVDEISERISELEECRGSRILMQGGVNPDLPLSWYTSLLSELRSRHPTIELDCFSPIEIEGISDVCGQSTSTVLQRLKEAGMHGLPGGGAEMLVDDVRKDISPLKGSAENWLRIMGEAQELGLTTSATNVFGFGETPSDRVEHMSKIRKMQDSAISNGNTGFTSFVSWPVQLENNAFGRRNRGLNRIEMGASSSEYLRHLAVSRLFFDNIVHIQASWPTMGLEVAQVALLGGADDAGSTMMEENVVSASGTDRTEATEKELQRIISLAGFTPRKRDSDYNKLQTVNVYTMQVNAPPPVQW
ncbi:MAG: CofH family radical SAM protein [Candidatus Thalassarchaeaceae archaeon]|nr:CofH family radical SAM protein [Candidatus Thalassarchaeaceae archaeon]